MTVSGDTVALWRASGRNPVYITNISGNNAAQVLTPNADGLLDGNAANAGIFTQSMLLGKDANAGRLNRIRCTASGSVGSASGTVFRLLTANVIQDPHNPNKIVSTTEMSGAGSSLDINGLNTAAITFGFQPQSQRLENIATVPQFYYGTDDLTGHRLLVDATRSAYTIKTGDPLVIPSSGGGIELPNQFQLGFAQQGIKLKVVSANGPVWIGSFHYPPNSGVGYPIVSGESIDIPVHNADIVRLYAQTSGALVAFMYFSNDTLP